MTAVVLLFAVGALPALFICGFAYLIAPRSRLLRLALVLCLAASTTALLWRGWPLLLLAVPAFILTLLAFEFAARTQPR